MKLRLQCRGETFAVEVVERGGERAFSVNGRPCAVQLVAAEEGAFLLLVEGRLTRAHVALDGQRIFAALSGETYEFTLAEEKQTRGSAEEPGKPSPEILSPMPGKILEVRVCEGAAVQSLAPLVVLEAMKMENVIEAPAAAVIKKIHVRPGDVVDVGQLLVELEPLA